MRAYDQRAAGGLRHALRKVTNDQPRDQSAAIPFRLDPAGNKKAAELLMNTGKRRSFHVQVAGDLNKNTLQVSSISIAK